MVLRGYISERKIKYIGRAISCLALIVAMTLVLSGIGSKPMVAYASSSEEATTDATVDDRWVYDEAGLLSAYELEELESLSHKYGKEAGIEIFILTHDDSGSTYPEKYIEDFEDRLPLGDRIYFLYDVYRGEIFMEGYGLAETYIHSKRIDKIFDNVADDLRSKNYYNAFKTYIIMSADYMKDDSELNYDHNYIYDSPPIGFDPDYEYSYDDYDYNSYYREDTIKNSLLANFWFQLIASLAIGGIVVGIMAYNSGGRMTVGARDYLDSGRGGLIGRRDQYIRSSVTRWRKPQNNTSSVGSRGGFNAGGFRGGVSSGGRSHSSGGRKL